MECTKRKRKECYFKCFTFCKRADGVCMWGFEEVLHFETNCFIPCCLREISGFSSSGASQVVSHLMALCSKASRGVDLHWPSVTLYNGDCSQVQARVACLKFVSCSTLARQAQGDTEWSHVSASLFVPCVKTWLFRSSDFRESPQLWEADGEQSPDDTSQLLQHLWTAHQHHSWFSAVNLTCFMGTKFHTKSPGKNSRQMINFPICLLIRNLKSTGRANREKKLIC